MKLRNKKTGEIKEGVEISVWLDKEGTLKFITLTDLNEEWEDYTPQEPLIKDEKIRKALKVWADENRIKKVGFKLDKGNTSCACYFYDESCDICEFGLKFYLAIDADKIYTITELCGEEEDER